MREFKTFDGHTIDLDDLSNYVETWQEMNIGALFRRCMDSAGSSLFYMDFLHPFFGEGEQRNRVIVLCKELAEIWHSIRKFDADTKKCTLLNEPEYRLALMSWLYRLEDETENQC